jgi:hypothetical protein
MHEWHAISARPGTAQMDGAPSWSMLPTKLRFSERRLSTISAIMSALLIVFVSLIIVALRS